MAYNSLLEKLKLAGVDTTGLENEQNSLLPGERSTEITPSIFDSVSSQYQDQIKKDNIDELPSQEQVPSLAKSKEMPKMAQPESPDSKMDSTGYQLGTLENLQNAQNKANVLKTMGAFSNIGTDLLNTSKGIGDMFVSNPNKVAYSKDTGQSLSEAGDTVLKNQKDTVENQKNDPKSQTSASMRDVMKKMGFPVSENVSAADLEKKFPAISQIYNARESEKSRAAMAKENREARLEAAKLAAETKKEAKDEKKEQKTNDYIFAAQKAAEPIVKNYTKSKLAADSVRSMKGENPAEQITALYSLVKGLDPDSAVREGEVGLAQSISSIMGRAETLFNKASTGGVVDTKTLENLKKEIIRLEGDAKKSYDTRMGTYRNQFKSRGISEDRLNELDPYATTVSKKQDPKIEEYAKAHLGGDYNKAKAILTGRGYKPNE